MDSTMEFYSPFIYYYPSLPTVPWTRWTVLWNPSIHSGLAYPTVHVDSTMESVISTLSYPILLYHGQYYGIQVSI